MRWPENHRQDALAQLLGDLRRPGGAADEWLSSPRVEEALQASWASCTDPAVLMSLHARTGDRPRLVLAACGCARLGLIHVPAGEDRPARAIETAEAWVRGSATIDEVRTAAEAAWCAAGRTGFQDERTRADEPAASAASFAAQAIFNKDAEFIALHDAQTALTRYGGLSQDAAAATLAAVVRAHLPCPTLHALQLGQ